MFSAAEKAHYERHFQLPELGESGQLKLKKSSVLVVGAGGCPLNAHLQVTYGDAASAGVSGRSTSCTDAQANSEMHRQAGILTRSAQQALPRAAPRPTAG